MLCFLTDGLENAGKSQAVCLRNRSRCGLSRGARFEMLRGLRMTRVLAWLCAATTVLLAGHAQAQEYDMRDIMGGGPNFRSGGYGGGGSISRSTVSFPVNYAPGTIVINTGERRLYLVTGNGQALRYGIGVGRDGFRWSGTHRITAKREWPAWTPPA